ncbi:Glutamate 5-kinase [Candidatus Providencia siddallii]|uniref:Glutamate 5-kinase n=1 Tax=Candidatus Providencia siddallii TaxID=1715285 RepID=A0ABM9NPT3_9GAMM
MKKNKTLVVKFGTSLLTNGTQHLNKANIIELVKQCVKEHKNGNKIIIVTSGAIAAGREHLNFPKLPNTIISNQLLASIGQIKLIQLWKNFFSIYGINIGQILLTRDDLENHKRFLNAKNTLHALLDNGIIPVINENDAVATDEIKVGDNDNLSAFVAILGDAENLLLLTDIKGLYDSDPRNNPNAKFIPEVYDINDKIKNVASKSVTGLGKGGMITKLQAANIAVKAGIDVIIANGKKPNVINYAIKNIKIGTHFYGKIN